MEKAKAERRTEALLGRSKVRTKRTSPVVHLQMFPSVAEFEPFPEDADSGYRRYSQSLQLVMMDFQYIEECSRIRGPQIQIIASQLDTVAVFERSDHAAVAHAQSTTCLQALPAS